VFQIDNTVISDLLIKKKFVCDLSACKGACCIHGDSGAPLEESEAQALDKYFEKIRPFMRPEGIAAVEESGCHYIDDEHDTVTMLIGGAECAYTVFDADGITWCAVEKAFLAGEVPFRKPISCYLYPVRTKKIGEFEAVNYDEWGICKAALKLGKKTDTPVYRFLQAPLTEKFGAEWYEQLDYLAKHYAKDLR